MGQQAQAINQALVNARATTATNQTINATPTGSSDTSILRFNAAAAIGGDIVETTTAAGGTQVFLRAPGIYYIGFSLTASGAAQPIAAGISFAASTAVAIVADPVVNVANVIASADVVGLAAIILQINLGVIVTVTEAAAVLARAASTAAVTARVMFHATDSGAAAPVGIAAASVQYRIIKLSESDL